MSALRCVDPALIVWTVVVVLILLAGAFFAGVQFGEGGEP